MTVVPQIRSTLPQVRWPVLDAETGRASVAFTRGIDRLARAKTSKDAVLSARLQETATGVLRRDDDLRREKVERLRAAIADGTYFVSAEALAEKMIERIADADSLHTKKDNI